MKKLMVFLLFTCCFNTFAYAECRLQDVSSIVARDQYIYPKGSDDEAFVCGDTCTDGEVIYVPGGHKIGNGVGVKKTIDENAFYRCETGKDDKWVRTIDIPTKNFETDKTIITEKTDDIHFFWGWRRPSGDAYIEVYKSEFDNHKGVICNEDMNGKKIYDVSDKAVYECYKHKGYKWIKTCGGDQTCFFRNYNLSNGIKKIGKEDGYSEIKISVRRSLYVKEGYEPVPDTDDKIYIHDSDKMFIDCAPGHFRAESMFFWCYDPKEEEEAWCVWSTYYRKGVEGSWDSDTNTCLCEDETKTWDKNKHECIDTKQTKQTNKTNNNTKKKENNTANKCQTDPNTDKKIDEKCADDADNAAKDNDNDKKVDPNEEPKTEVEPNAVSKEQLKAATDSLKSFFDYAEANRSVWRDAYGKFNTARLASDLTAGVVLGTVGGVVSGVVIKKKQVEKGFDALQCTVGGQKVADWGDKFTVGLQK